MRRKNTCGQRGGGRWCHSPAACIGPTYSIYSFFHLKSHSSYRMRKLRAKWLRICLCGVPGGDQFLSTPLPEAISTPSFILFPTEPFICGKCCDLSTPNQKYCIALEHTGHPRAPLLSSAQNNYVTPNVQTHTNWKENGVGDLSLISATCFWY